MTTLEELFADGLARQSDAVAEPDFAALEGAVLGGARRRRRIRIAGQLAVTCVATAIAVGVASVLVRNTDAPPPAATPTPSSALPTPAARPRASADPLMPQAAAITEAQWRQVDASWDIELATLKNADPSTESITLYLTPPGGDRLVAYADVQFPVADVSLLGFDAGERSLYLFGGQERQLLTLNLTTGSLSATDFQIDGETLLGAFTLGQTPEGKGVIVLNYFNEAAGTETYHVFVIEGDHAAENFAGPGVPVAMLSGDVLTGSDSGYAIHPLDGSAITTVPARDCSFISWSTDGTITAWCGPPDGSTGQTIEIDPTTGEQREVAASPDTWTPIDSSRAWRSFRDHSVVQGPPLLDNGDGTITDLSDGFLRVPDGYSVIFGVRS